MADTRDLSVSDPLAYDFLRNEAELGGNYPIYRTDIALSGGLQFAPSASTQYFGQTLAPIIEAAKNPWVWVFVAFGVLIAVTMKSKQ